MIPISTYYNELIHYKTECIKHLDSILVQFNNQIKNYDISVWFLNIIHATETMKQNNSGFPKMSLDRSGII